MNTPNIQNNIGSISSLQNGLGDPLNTTGFYFKSKDMEDSYKGGK